MTPRIYTKTGDDGRTGLFGGGRVNKDHVRVEAYGDVDELNAVIGSARSVEMMPRIDEILAPVQRDLLAIGALLATPPPEKHREGPEKAPLPPRPHAPPPSRPPPPPAARRTPPRSTSRARFVAARSAPSSVCSTSPTCRRS